MKMQELNGMRVRGSTARAGTVRDRVIDGVWVSDTGDYMAWSRHGKSGEHLRGATEQALIRRVMSLAS